MKKSIFPLITTLFFTFQSLVNAQDISQVVAQCAAAADAVYLKDYVVNLDASTPGGAPNQARFALMLSKNTKYRFSVCPAPNSEGEPILQLYDMNVMVGSTFIEATGKDFHMFDFNCQKSAIYHIFISFKEGKAGEAVGILSFVKRL
jgi:hypothetical protein